MNEAIPKLNVIAIGGPHQFPHFLPPVFRLHADRRAEVEIFVVSLRGAEAVAKLSERVGLPCPVVTILRLPPILTALFPRRYRDRLLKVPRLLLWGWRLRRADALLCAERTSTALRWLPGGMPRFIHMLHGAGDRRVGFEPRLAHFDHILTVGEKDRTRIVEEGLRPPWACHVAGPVKLASLRPDASARSLFGNDRPVILYNPHFRRKLGSFRLVADKLIDAILADGGYNLIVAPHVRLAESWPESEIARWEARSVAGRVIVDMGSEKSHDMSYTSAAHLYLGDVSSQVYEFLAYPRPCLFFNSHGAEWRNDPNYVMWRFGPVIGPDDELVPAIDDAFSSHTGFRAAQEEGAKWALGLQQLFPGGFPPDRQACMQIIDEAAARLESLLELSGHGCRRTGRRRTPSAASPNR